MDNSRFHQEVIHLEELAMNAFPAIITEVYDGWLLRYSNGYTYRGNSVNPIYKSKYDIDKKIDLCEEKYFKKGLPCVFKMTALVDESLDEKLAIRGYKIKKEANIMEMPLDNKTFNKSSIVTITNNLTEEWLNEFVILNGTENEPMKSTAKEILRNIINETISASIYVDNKMIACGLGVVEDKQLGLFDIRVLEEYRLKGYGKAICESILAEGIEKGAKTSYLQVMSTNTIAINMYTKLGYNKLYTYWYRVKNINNNQCFD